MIDTLFAFLVVGFLLGVGNILSEASARRADAEPFHPREVIVRRRYPNGYDGGPA